MMRGSERHPLLAAGTVDIEILEGSSGEENPKLTTWITHALMVAAALGVGAAIRVQRQKPNRRWRP
jgi:hypothetical protein